MITYNTETGGEEDIDNSGSAADKCVRERMLGRILRLRV